MPRKLDPEEKLARRRERTRLIAYLLRGGILLKEELPAGDVAWVCASRSGRAYSGRGVERLRKRGAKVRGQWFWLLQVGTGDRLKFEPVD